MTVGRVGRVPEHVLGWVGDLLIKLGVSDPLHAAAEEAHDRAAGGNFHAIDGCRRVTARAMTLRHAFVWIAGSIVEIEGSFLVRFPGQTIGRSKLIIFVGSFAARFSESAVTANRSVHDITGKLDVAFIG